MTLMKQAAARNLRAPPGDCEVRLIGKRCVEGRVKPRGLVPARKFEVILERVDGLGVVGRNGGHVFGSMAPHLDGDPALGLVHMTIEKARDYRCAACCAGGNLESKIERLAWMEAFRRCVLAGVGRSVWLAQRGLYGGCCAFCVGVCRWHCGEFLMHRGKVFVDG